MKPQPSVQLHIERLVVDESLLSDGRGHKLQSAIESELTELVRGNGLIGLTSGALYSLAARDMPIARQASSLQVGRQIAQTVYGALSPQSEPAATQDRQRMGR